LISDCQSAALTSSDGSVDWLCFPRFDRPSVFARLLDEGGGHWSIRPAGEFQSERAYLEQTMALETTFRSDEGWATLTDVMAVGDGEREHQLGTNSPHALLRRLTCTKGSIGFEIEYAPRPEYGLIFPFLTSLKTVSGREEGQTYYCFRPP
jgi:GH15 family glucan-1,4-alpha-glucosidase